ncbi:MAG: hypothetical protein NPINA01_22960 [Nitrospinaceae bacterium]|nr:MAG: hypothetical protein NPINA01_22960 [Nitrospinaceae bacterium]
MDGKCCNTHPPCVPRQSLKTYRRRLVILVVSSLFALICVSWMTDQLQENYFGLSAGPLSSSHIKFAEKDGCQVCHEPHRKSAFNWLKASVTPVNLSAKCEECHVFGGPALKAHNGNIEETPQLQDTHCLMCHREHKGEAFGTRTFTSRKCNFCHKTQFKSFSSGHPEFSTDYPHSKTDSIKFNHSTHLKKHFLEPKHSDKAPENCMGCHKLMNQGSFQSGKFEVVCADCHKSQILTKDLVLIRLPELDKNRIDKEAIMKACGIMRGSSAPQKGDEDFLSISTDTPTLTTSYLLNTPEDDPEGYSEKLQDLILAMAQESTSPIANLIDRHSPRPIAKQMLAGLNPEVVKRAACAWGLNAEYDPPAKASFGGWHADLLEMRYTPVDHKDPVALSWIEFALAVPLGKMDDMKRERALAMRDQMLSSKEGVGGCFKCHAANAAPSLDGENRLSIHWGYKDLKNLPYLKFSHKSHLDVLGKGKACKTCHVLNESTPLELSANELDSMLITSNFNPMNKNTCMKCHTKGKVRQECQLCHSYHLEPGFKEKVTLANNPSTGF